MDSSLSASTTKLAMDDTLSIKGRRFTKSHLITLIVAAVFITLTVCLVIALAVVSSNSRKRPEYTSVSSSAQSGGKDDVCVTAACAQAASTILSAMDDTAKPCDDFYQYACGGWIERNIIPEFRSSYSQFTKLGDQQAIILRAFLEEDGKPTDPLPLAEARDLYQAGADEETIEKLGKEPLEHLHEHLGGWPMTDPTWNGTGFDLYHTLSELRLLSNEYLVGVWVSTDIKDNTKNVVQLDQFYLSLPSRDYYLEDKFSKELEAYRTLVLEIALHMGANETTAKKDVDDLIEFETYMANITIPHEERRDLQSLYNRYTIEELKTNISDKFEWKMYFNLLFIDIDYTFYDSTEVVVYSPTFLKNMAEKVAVTDPRVLANYLVWRITEYRITNLPQAFLDIQNKFYRVAYSIPEEPPRWKRCVSYTERVMGFAVGRLFVDTYFKEDSKAEMEKMTAEVQKVFDEMLHEAVWMDESTKAYAKEKREAMTTKIGFPNWLYNDTALDVKYEGLKFNHDEHFANHLEFLRWIEIEGFKKIIEPVDKDRWLAYPHAIDAYYSHKYKPTWVYIYDYSDTLNQIILRAGALQPPFYEKDRPRYLNYAGIGSFIGHAITHGFDDIGQAFDKDGNVRNWWDNTTKNAYKDKIQCIIDQYSSYVVPEIHENINGVNTQAEDVADNGGMRVGYRAYMKHAEKYGEGQRLPGLTQYNSKQTFFLSYAQIQCRISRLSSLKAAVATGFHSPSRFRVNGALSNSREFSEAFSCPVGSTMNPAKKCIVW